MSPEAGRLTSAPHPSRQSHPAPALRSVAFALLASLSGYASASFIYLYRLSSEFSLRYSDSGLPMLGEADGYYHLWRSRALLDGAASWSGEPALSVLGAAAQLVTRVPLELAAFWLPALLAVVAGLWTWSWGRLFNAPQIYCALAAFIGGLIPAWFTRACPGWYDTDPGIALLWHGGLFATACLSLAPERPSLRHAVLLAACALLLAWWWKPGLLLLPLCLLLWGGTFCFATQPVWRTARLATALAVLACAALFFALPEALLPQPAAALQRYALLHASMSLGQTPDAVLRSIDELSGLPAAEILAELGGNAAAGLAALVCVGLLMLRAPRTSVFLLPSLGTVALALTAQRFLSLAALPLALGVGLLPWLLPQQLEAMHRRSPLSAKAARTLRCVAWLVSLAVVASLLYGLSRLPLKFPFQAPQDRIALTLKRVAPPDAKLWNWWDDGYFLAARSGLPPLFHGGSQTARMAYIAAHPLATDNPQLARRWIRFFALRGERGLGPLRAAWGDEAAALARLEEVLSAPDLQAALKSLPHLEPGADWLLPEGRVFLYLPQRFLKISMWWMGLGKTPNAEANTFKPHIDTFRRAGFRYNPARNQVELPPEVLAKGYTDFGAVYDTTRTPLVPPFGGGVPGPYVVSSELSPWLYIVDESAIRSVGFRLLAPGGLDLPGFAPVLTDYAHGGLWEVLP